MAKADYFLASRPLGMGPYSGDAGFAKESGKDILVGVVDVLGHGKEAHEVASLCIGFLRERFHRDKHDLVRITRELHNRLRGTRGAVGALCRIELASGSLDYICVGNITMRVFGSRAKRFVPIPGILGYQTRSLAKEKANLGKGDLLLVHTDGIREHFGLEDYPELMGGDPRSVAEGVIERFGREQDDALCFALRYKG
ncbi:MAG: SpoIIE family protein phosphatase [Deltaproteobacteria bacterium]|nr:SpoIIE family protein phosphatase [Deltaproteobacteria bacterium]MBW2136726.1 SpoIIE family protein phosphatase [Deltaproteobacteria bacterium]